MDVCHWVSTAAYIPQVSDRFSVAFEQRTARMRSVDNTDLALLEAVTDVVAVDGNLLPHFQDVLVVVHCDLCLHTNPTCSHPTDWQ